MPSGRGGDGVTPLVVQLVMEVLVSTWKPIPRLVAGSVGLKPCPGQAVGGMEPGIQLQGTSHHQPNSVEVGVGVQIGLVGLAGSQQPSGGWLGGW
jgi:hypothetical protein